MTSANSNTTKDVAGKIFRVQEVASFRIISAQGNEGELDMRMNHFPIRENGFIHMVDAYLQAMSPNTDPTTVNPSRLLSAIQRFSPTSAEEEMAASNIISHKTGEPVTYEEAMQTVDRAADAVFLKDKARPEIGVDPGDIVVFRNDPPETSVIAGRIISMEGRSVKFWMRPDDLQTLDLASLMDLEYGKLIDYTDPEPENPDDEMDIEP